VAGSPAAALCAALPPDLEPLPLPADGPIALGPDDTAVLLLDVGARNGRGAVDALFSKTAVPVVALIEPGAEGAVPPSCYAFLTKPVTPLSLAQALRNACEHARVSREAEETQKQLHELNAIGVRLTAERDTDALLDLILTKAREITRSDAGSLYVVEEPEDGRRRLRFKLAQNDSVHVPFTEYTLPISGDSVAGHVALSGEVLHLDDAYQPPPGSRFRINREFDDRVAYRTKSMLVVPMKTPPGEVIGVLQLINCKRHRAGRLRSAADIERDTLPYPERFRDLAASLASQAAVALENSRLYQSIRALFEGFVQASVTAIESRDPTTSGHSFRVADLTVTLAMAVDRAEHGPFHGVRFSPDQMKEIRYASLLHDFGKVGVREEVLVKAKKLAPAHLELIRQRAEIIRRGLELKYSRQKLEHALAAGPDDLARQSAVWDAELTALTDELAQYLKAVQMANEPSVMAEDSVTRIQHVATRAFVDHLGESHALITPQEADTLSIARGSLTDEEFRQIQSHVVHTYHFLRQIPWTTELRRVPEIARSHHEKLDGSGYPDGRRGTEIPMQSRMMTIADIFDALTASDRPYKSAVPIPRALEILECEARAGALDRPLLDLFVELRPWQHRGL